MTQQKEPITLYGSKAARFREIREQLEEEYGIEPTNPEVIFELMKDWDGVD
jgi:hypothetical protein